jgi:NAD(P)-dependent dehydrogenase (short-subunit alcohol dehydrogenase family)
MASPEDPTSRVGALLDLNGRVAIVTGASSGLGWRFAQVLHDAGATVVLAGRRAERLEELHRLLERSLPVPCDIVDPDQRGDLVRTAVERFGSVDVLVNNAGVSGVPVPAQDLPAERWDQTLAVNLSGLFGVTQLAGRQMLAQGRGSVINIGSVFGLVGNAPVMDAAYAATKGALVNLTRELALEWATGGVRVNTIAPGWFPSEMTSEMVEDEGSQRYIRRGCPMQRMGREEELDGALLFFASDASSYCTGQTLAIDGGWTAR